MRSMINKKETWQIICINKLEGKTLKEISEEKNIEFEIVQNVSDILNCLEINPEEFIQNPNKYWPGIKTEIRNRMMIKLHKRKAGKMKSKIRQLDRFSHESPEYIEKYLQGLKAKDLKEKEITFKVGQKHNDFRLIKIEERFNVWNYKGLYNMCFYHNEWPDKPACLNSNWH